MNDSNLGGFTSIGTSHRYLIDLSSITEENKKCNHESRIFTSILVIFQTCEKRVLSINAKFRLHVKSAKRCLQAFYINLFGIEQSLGIMVHIP